MGRMVLVALVVLDACMRAPAVESDLAVAGVTVIDLRTGELFPDQTILINGGRIVAVVLVPGVSLHDELEALVRDVGLSPLAALRAATLEPARVFGLADSLGTVEPGMLADLVLLRANPLTDIRHSREIAGVVIGGRYFAERALDSLIASAAASS